MEIRTEHFKYLPSKGITTKSLYKQPFQIWANNWGLCYRELSEASIHFIQLENPDFIERMINSIASIIYHYNTHKGYIETTHIPNNPINEFSIPYSYNHNKTKEVEKIISQVKFLDLAFDAPNEFSIALEKNNYRFNIPYRDKYLIYYGICAILSYINKEEVEVFIDKKSKEVVYISPPSDFVNFLMKKKTENFLTSNEALAISLSKLSKIKDSIPNWMYEDIEADDFWWRFVYIKTSEGSTWTILHSELFMDTTIDLNNNKIRQNLIDTDKLKCCFNLFKRSNTVQYIYNLVPVIYVDVEKNEILISSSYRKFFEGNIANKINSEHWKIKNANIIRYIPLEDRYWIINGCDLIHELYGNSISNQL